MLPKKMSTLLKCTVSCKVFPKERTKMKAKNNNSEKSAVKSGMSFK